MAELAEKKGNGSKYLRTLVFCAALAAISIVLSRYASINIGNGYRIGFGRLPVILASAWFGMIAGGATGGVADILGALISTGWNPVLTIPAVLAGVLPRLFFRLFGLKPGNNEGKPIIIYLKILICVLVPMVLTSGFLMTALLSIYYASYRSGFIVFLINRNIVAVIESIIESIVIYFLYTNKSLTKVIKPLVR